MPTIAVVFGGPSHEHEVSLVGARSAIHHARGLGWQVAQFGISKSGQWLVGPGALMELLRLADPDLLPGAPHVHGATDHFDVYDGPPPAEMFARVDAVLPVCHGQLVEDGALQGLLAWYGTTVMGCGVDASLICFDKRLTRAVLNSAGLPTARGVAISAEAARVDQRLVGNQVREALGTSEVFVKPARGGSSLGIGRARDSADLLAALSAAHQFDQVALVEEFVPHREFVVGVVGVGDDLLVSPPGECVPVGDLYTYEEKYKLGNPGFRCPADIDAATVKSMRDLAAAAFRAVGCRVFARVDLFLDTSTGRILVNEINTIPGMTEVSVFPKVMAAAGLSYPMLLTALYRLATGSRVLI